MGVARHPPPADFVPLRPAAQDEDAVRVELAVSPAAERLGGNRPALAKSRHQIDDKRGRHPEMGRRGTPRMPSLDVIHHTLAKIHRIGLRHRKSPPTGSESHSHPRRNPRRFNLTVRCSSIPWAARSAQSSTRICGQAACVAQAKQRQAPSTMSKPFAPVNWSSLLFSLTSASPLTMERERSPELRLEI